MARILALDAATEACSVALIDGERRFARFEVQPRQHAKLLLPMVDAVMQEAGLRPAELDALAVGRGPGSFTGVRIAVATAQGLAFAAGLPCIPVSNLLALAQASGLPEGELGVMAIDARMSEVYWALCRRTEGRLQLETEERVEAMTAVQWSPEPRVCAAGTGWEQRELCGQSDEIGDCRPDCLPSAEAIAEIALGEWQRGETVKAENLMPVYLRNQVTG